LLFREQCCILQIDFERAFSTEAEGLDENLGSDFGGKRDEDFSGGFSTCSILVDGGERIADYLQLWKRVCYGRGPQPVCRSRAATLTFSNFAVVNPDGDAIGAVDINGATYDSVSGEVSLNLNPNLGARRMKALCSK
jgi:hypothetical protein